VKTNFCVLAGPEHQEQRILIRVMVSFSLCAVLGINISLSLSLCVCVCTVKCSGPAPVGGMLRLSASRPRPAPKPLGVHWIWKKCLISFFILFSDWNTDQIHAPFISPRVSSQYKFTRNNRLTHHYCNTIHSKNSSVKL